MHPKIAAAAPKLAKAQPKTASAVMTLFRVVILPILPMILTELAASDRKGKYRSPLLVVRSVLNGMDLGDARD